ncbi:MAG TPA: glucose-6-phosphate dehydrogenase, partial [Polyangia bacterium]|nr:glucose-6-phosphate dehydrogenase [Polyangia bacterium]
MSAAPEPAPSSSSSSPPAAVPNPLREGLHEERIPEPATMVIFGASGDLTKRKLVPALYSLARDRLLAARFAVVGYARKPLAETAFRDELRAGCDEFARRRPVDPELWNTFANNVFYQEGSYDDPPAYVALKKRLEEIEAALGLPGNRVFYLSIPPASFATVVEHLGASGLTRTSGDRFARVIIEKPFGTDLATAQALNRHVHKCLTEKQIYRIDHYLGKETVQNLLVFRFA